MSTPCFGKDICGERFSQRDDVRACFYNNVGCGICGEMYSARNAAKSCFHKHIVNGSNEQSTASEISVKLRHSQEPNESADLDELLCTDSACDDDYESNLRVSTSICIDKYTDGQLCSQEIIDSKKDKFLLTTGVTSVGETIPSVLSSDSTPKLKVKEQRSEFKEPMYRCNPIKRSGVSSNSTNSKHQKHSSVTNINGLSGGRVNEVNDVNSQSWTVLDTTSSLTYQVVHLAKNDRAIDSSPDTTIEKASEQTTVAESSMRLYSCSVCGERFHRKGELTTHLICHTQDNSHPSPPRGFDQSNGGDNSIQGMDNSIECNYAGELGVIDKQQTVGNSEKPFVCTLCPYRSRRQNELTVHSRTHSGEKPFSCAECPYRSGNFAGLSLHMRSHSGEKPFACTTCSYRCSRSNDLSRHARKHTGENNFACALCPYRCGKSNVLAEHMRSHTGEKPFACKLCDFRCSFSGSLARHVRSHAEDKQFACRQCSYECSLSESLAVHMRSHTGEKPFACKLCDFRCSFSGNLSRHMRSHSGEKPFECSQCSFACSISGSLIRHMRRHKVDA